MADPDKEAKRLRAATYVVVGIGGALLLGAVFFVGMRFADVVATGQVSEPVADDNAGSASPKPSPSPHGVSGKTPPEVRSSATPTPSATATPQPVPAGPPVQQPTQPPAQQPAAQPAAKPPCPTGGRAFSLVSVEYSLQSSSASGSPSPYDYFDVTGTLEVTNVSNAATYGGVVISGGGRPGGTKAFLFDRLYLTLQPGETVTIYDTIYMERSALEPVTTWYISDSDGMESLWDDSQFIFCEKPGHALINAEVTPYYTSR